MRPDEKLNEGLAGSTISLQVYIEDLGMGQKEIGLMVITSSGTFGIEIPRDKAVALANDLRKAADVLDGGPIPRDAQLMS